MRNFQVGGVAGSPVVTEITQFGISNVNLLSAVATRYGTQVFTLTSAAFALTSSGFRITIPSGNVTSNNSPMEVVISYNGAEIVNLKVVVGVAASAGAQEVTASTLPLPAGAASETTIASINTKTPALGASSPAGSSPVVLPNDVVVNGGSALSALNTDLLTGTVNGWYDAQNAHSVTIQIIGSAGISAGQIVFEQTNDTTAAPAGVTLPVFESSNLTGDPIVSTTVIAASTVRLFEAPVLARYIRVRISTAFVGGTVQAVGVFSQLPYASTRLNVRQGTAGNLNANVSQATAANLNATAIVSGNAGEDTGTTSNPVIIGGVVRTATAVTSFLAGDAARQTMTTGLQALVKPYGLPETDWQFTSALTTTTAAAAKAAGAAGIRNYVTDISFQNTSATATTVLLLDGGTTIAQWNAPANMPTPAVIQFVTPRRGTAATAMNVNCGTTGANVLINVGGYQAP